MISAFAQKPARTDEMDNKQQNGAKSQLEDLHVELVDHILRFLVTGDIASLRLTSCTMVKKATQPIFTSLFKRKEVLLSTESLEKMVGVTADGRLGCLLQHCTITGIAIATTLNTPTPNTTTRDLQLLTQAFRNLKKYSPDGVLESICLRVTAREVDWRGKLVQPQTFKSQRTVWAAALETFDLVMEALRQSGLCVDELDIFDTLRGCSLDISHFMEKFNAPDLLRSLKRLRMSLGPTPAMQPWRIEEDAEYKVHNPSAVNHTGWRRQDSLLAVSQVLERTQNLQSLKVHWYSFNDVYNPKSLEPAESNDVSSPDSDKGTSLRECSLHGIWVPARHLLKFLQMTQVEQLTLAEISLLEGTYEPIFEYMSSPACSIRSYHLDDLRECTMAETYRNRVHFKNERGEPRAPLVSEDRGSRSLLRTGTAVKDPISYHAPGRPHTMLRPEVEQWAQRRELIFGGRYPEPGYDFISLNLPRDHGQGGSSSSSNRV